MGKKKAILIDLHKTLLNEEGKPNKIIAQMLKALAKDYAICVITADFVESPKEMEKEILSSEIPYTGFYYSASEQDDVDKKLDMLEEIQKDYEVCLIIDNNKKVIKEFKKLGIDTLRFREGDLE